MTDRHVDIILKTMIFFFAFWISNVFLFKKQSFKIDMLKTTQVIKTSLKRIQSSD